MQLSQSFESAQRQVYGIGFFFTRVSAQAIWRGSWSEMKTYQKASHVQNVVDTIETQGESGSATRGVCGGSTTRIRCCQELERSPRSQRGTHVDESRWDVKCLLICYLRCIRVCASACAWSSLAHHMYNRWQLLIYRQPLSPVDMPLEWLKNISRDPK